MNRLNQEAKAEKNAKKEKQISDDSPEKLIGYFPMKNINDKLSVKKYIDLMLAGCKPDPYWHEAVSWKSKRETCEQKIQGIKKQLLFRRLIRICT